MDLVLVPVSNSATNHTVPVYIQAACCVDDPLPNSHAFLHICGGQVLVKVDHKLGKLLDVDHILRMVRVCIYDLSASGNLHTHRHTTHQLTIDGPPNTDHSCLLIT